MKEESELISKLMEETMAENRESSYSEPLSHNNILKLHDKLFKAYGIEVYRNYMRVSFEHGDPIDIPRGLGFFHNEEQVFDHWKEYPSFEMEIVDSTFREVISDHLFVSVNKAILFNYENSSFIVFYDSQYEDRVWEHIQSLTPASVLKAA